MTPETSITKNAERYVMDYLEAFLPPGFGFHNIQHAREVKEAVSLIGDYLSLPAGDIEVLRIAASFHDTGYCHTYSGHEDRSITIASVWLSDEDYPIERIARVASCIEATRFPQSPNDLLGQVLCDADLFHFASLNYPDYEHRLRLEWERRLDRFYSDQDWARTNCEALIAQTYFTSYGKKVLQPLKERNIELLRCRY
ncbi:HD domain-containing protein [Hufsiella ginkgonis]|uniref:HD domain-containing protein n=1 Tax=Hufsiella ginkgonis TaxID=2695274 RepID=A0A7K1XU49_9SPHI|nr:HD domain-containing protein [Hufsiella ginkgonis]MXV14026.1 HD domain-containing protein [Hufsiella ginkgonis]